MENEEPIYSFIIPDIGRQFDFTAHDLLAWADKEQNAWQDFRNLNTYIDGGFTDYVHNKLIETARNIYNWASYDKIGRKANQSMYENSINSIKSGRFIYSESPFGLKILELIKKNPHAAAIVAADKLGLLDNRDGSYQSEKDIYRAALAAARAEINVIDVRDLKERFDGVLKGLSSDWDGRLRGVCGRAETAVEGAVNREGEISRQMTQHQVMWDQFCNATKNKFEKTISDHAEELLKIQKEYKEEMRLRAPSEYWKSKEDAHDVAAKRWLWIFTVAALAILGVTFCFAPAYLRALPQNGLPGIAALTLPVIVALWSLRHPSRIFTTHFHQREDARQRRILVQTYLALRGDGAATDQERLLILHALFRPNAMQDGDDPGAAALMESIAKQIGK